MRAIARALTGCLAAGTMVAVAACGGSHLAGTTRSVTSPTAVNSRTIDIYSSLPLQGVESMQGESIVSGIELALSQAGLRAGKWIVDYRSLNDATAADDTWADTWDPTATTADARLAAQDPRAVYYVGEFSSEASEAALQLLNQARVPQVSPGSTYVGLTSDLPGSSLSEPEASGVRTFFRLVPDDSVQAAADLMAIKDAGCRQVAVATDKSTYGDGMAALLESEKDQYGVTIGSDTGIDAAAGTAPADFRPYAESLRHQGADCFFFAGTPSPAAVAITEAVNAALPKARLFAPDQMCTSEWTNPKLGGVPASIDPLIECTLPVLSLSAYPGGRQFLAAWKAKYGASVPNPWAIYGYESMRLGLDTIAALGPEGNNKLAVLRALFSIRRRNSVLGTYGFDRDGDTTLRSYGLYKVSAGGDPVFDESLTPPGAGA